MNTLPYIYSKSYQLSPTDQGRVIHTRTPEHSWVKDQTPELFWGWL